MASKGTQVSGEGGRSRKKGPDRADRARTDWVFLCFFGHLSISGSKSLLICPSSLDPLTLCLSPWVPLSWPTAGDRGPWLASWLGSELRHHPPPNPVFVLEACGWPHSPRRRARSWSHCREVPRAAPAAGQAWDREMCLGHPCGQRTHACGCGSGRREQAGRPVVDGGAGARVPTVAWPNLPAACFCG